MTSIPPRTTFASLPSPPSVPVLGHVPLIDPEKPVQSMMKLAAKYGPVLRMKFPARDFLLVGTHALMDELSDDTRFRKLVHQPLRLLQPIGGIGLFTVETADPEWGAAHRVLMPAFGPQAMRDMFDPMLDIAEQLVVKWERQGFDKPHDVAAEMTQLTLDTIALCGFGYRFNSFYQNELHPFVDAMVRSLAEAGERTRQLPIQTKLRVRAQRQFESDIEYMNHVADALIADRKAGRTSGTRDLLSLMLEGRDPQTGQRLSDHNIRSQMVTFLIAGHETTSGLLSFALYEMTRHPDVLARARAEVDRVMGNATPRFEHLAKLTYLDQVLRETLRLWPTAPAFALTPTAPTTLRNGLEVKEGDDLFVLVPTLHRDPAVWAQPEVFDPERWAPGNRERIPAHAWKPFGTGVRACIGRPFALQESMLVLAMLLQRFELTARAGYALDVKETLTLKPDGFQLQVRERAQKAAPVADVQAPVAPVVPRQATHGTPLLVLFGSNTGSSEAFARRIAGDAEQRGWAVSVAPMDSSVGKLPKAGALVVVTASYNGHPPDNARAFCDWLDGAAPGTADGLSYVVFGCGHRDWATTYQAVPARIDAALERVGAKRLMPRGEADARSDFFGDFDGWYATWWSTVDAALGVRSEPVAERSLYSLQTLTEGPVESARTLGFVPATVLENRELVDLSSPLGRSKRHVVVELPQGTAWQCGDSLAVLSQNPPSVVARVLRRFNLSADAVVQLSSARPSASTLPLHRPVSVRELLASHVELSQPATRRQVEVLAAATRCPPERVKLEALAAAHREKVLEPRVSLLQLLELAPACELTFAAFLELLPPLKPRLYSVASSPKVDARRVALTVSVLRSPSWSGNGTYEGAGSTTLERAVVGEQVWVSVRAPTLPFRPANASVPMVLIAAGTGLAPFRGFLVERQVAKRSGEAVAPTWLYFGCDHPDVDFLYRDELRAMEGEGVVSVRPTFFKAPEGEQIFVQHRLWNERQEVAALVDSGASIFICGDGKNMAPAVKETLARILGAERFAELERSGRIVADVFS